MAELQATEDPQWFIRLPLKRIQYQESVVEHLVPFKIYVFGDRVTYLHLLRRLNQKGAKPQEYIQENVGIRKTRDANHFHSLRNMGARMHQQNIEQTTSMRTNCVNFAFCDRKSNQKSIIFERLPHRTSRGTQNTRNCVLKCGTDMGCLTTNDIKEIT